MHELNALEVGLCAFPCIRLLYDFVEGVAMQSGPASVYLTVLDGIQRSEETIEAAQSSQCLMGSSGLLGLGRDEYLDKCAIFGSLAIAVWKEEADESGA